MKALRHTGVVVTNLEMALGFYRDLLGLKVVKMMNESGDFIDKITGLTAVNVTTVKMSAEDGNLIELLYFHSHSSISKNRPLNQIGASHLAFSVESVEHEYRKLSNHGVKFCSFPQVSPDGYAKVAFCQDPDGTFIELVEVLKK